MPLLFLGAIPNLPKPSEFRFPPFLGLNPCPRGSHPEIQAGLSSRGNFPLQDTPNASPRDVLLPSSSSGCHEDKSECSSSFLVIPAAI